MMEDIIRAACRELEGVPTEIQVIPFGEHRTGKGVFLLDEKAAASVMREAASVANDLVIDYEHQSLGDAEAPAAGWIKKLVDKGRGGIWAVVEWTPRAASYLKNREYRYLSPVFLRRLSDNRVVRLLHAALTNTPAIDGMVPITNKAQQRSRAAGGAPLPQENSSSQGKMYPWHPDNGRATEQRQSTAETTQKEGRSMKRLMAALGLTETATEDDATAAVAALKAEAEAIVANRAVFEALELDPSAPESEVTGLITALKASHARVDEAIRCAGDLESQLAERDAEDAVAFAMNVGKITPAERQWALDYAKRDPEGFKTYVNKTPVKVHRGEVARDGAFRRSAGPDEAQVSVNRMLGVSEETHRRHHGAGK